MPKHTVAEIIDNIEHTRTMVITLSYNISKIFRRMKIIERTPVLKEETSFVNYVV